MPRALSWILAAGAALAAGVAVRAHAPAPAAAQTPALPPARTPGSGFATSTTAVVVDVVVRDAKGAPIVDLEPSDFELLEDGVKQRVASFELIAPGRLLRGQARQRGRVIPPSRHCRRLAPTAQARRRARP